MGERDHDRTVGLEALADAGVEALDAEEAVDREASHGQDQLGSQEVELGVVPG